MPALSTSTIAALLHAYYPLPSDLLLAQLSDYLDLLLKWNARTNLTAIRAPEEIVRRHFGESLFTAAHLPPCRTILDIGSGAGFPGLPIHLALPGARVTLAESQNKKAAFLREAVRVLGCQAEVWGDRVERMPPQRKFDVVTMRAVDNPGAAFALAAGRVAEAGVIAHLTNSNNAAGEFFLFPGSTVAGLHIFH